ncbi:putative AAA+ superfamily ATPase [Acetoanaerobium pronyense]|uniref:AAA+ superfamily ATPase n=1 Tax=Acetoanaerobium pronyense TaxID=1482736 RepID=A0ABS4KPF3_9FIRM|nr:ATP-binding protein [Acetoanaerobium pronyense]MBP2028996.1 putative AAA+ superfamily ATPase [Acetoanaerobium pronyense]
MKNRDIYLSQLIKFKNKSLIKVITGLRRSGKSTLLSLFENHLIESGIKKNQIIRMNFESFDFDEIVSYKELYSYINSKIIDKNKKYYILLDEVQQVSSWEKVINSFLVDANVDIYLTGSNAYLLSSELSTLLSGRYVEIKMQPLSFKEHLNFIESDKESTIQEKFNQYLEYGGLPTVVELLDNKDTIGPFLEGIYNTVIMKDVIERNEVRDAALLESLLKFIAANIGSIVSTKKISDYLTSSGRKTTSDTIDNYLKMLENAFIIYKANRYDLKGKMFLKTLEKYYIVDMGIRNKLTGLRNTDYGHVLENIVYLELLRRGYDISIGKIGTLEVDFVATKPSEKIYYQVCATIMDDKTRERELRPLKSISDNYPKYILTMDQTVFNDYSGIKVKNIIDFLMQ